MAQRRNEQGLTPKQEAFCQAYVNAYGTPDFGNATAALLKAYNYSNRETAYREASRLMNDPQITTRLNEMLMDRLCEAEATAQALIDRDKLAANFDDGMLWETDPETGRELKISIKKLPKWVRVLGTWKSIGGRAVFVVDKEAARERLHKALIKTKVEHSVSDDFPLADGRVSISFRKDA
jgi:hypothetical protein